VNMTVEALERELTLIGATCTGTYKQLAAGILPFIERHIAAGRADAVTGSVDDAIRRAPEALSAFNAALVPSLRIPETITMRLAMADALLAAAPAPQHMTTQGKAGGVHGCEGSDERATRECLVPCDCGCGRSCCAMCGNDLGFIKDDEPPANSPESGVTDEIVERVAIAVSNVMRPHPDPRAYWEWLHEEERAKRRDIACAAIAAMAQQPKPPEANGEPDHSS